MTRSVQALVLALACAAAPARADFLSLLSIQTCTALPKTGFQLAVPELAVAPTGETLVAVCQVANDNTLSLSMWFYSKTGALVSGPQTVTTVGSMNGMRVAAGPNAFCLAMDIIGAPGDASGYGIFFRTYTLTGANLSASNQIQVNTLTSLDEVQPTVTGYSTTTGATAFAFTWVRRALTPPLTTSGIYARRFTATGVAIDAAEIRVDLTTVGFLLAPTIAAWPQGRFVVTWMDGAASGTGGATLDGSGAGVFARIFNNDLSPRSGQITVPSTTTNDQFQPFVGTDHKDMFLVGWTTRANPSVPEAVVRRFNDVGTPLDTLEVDVTNVASVFGYQLQGLDVAPSGEWIVAFDELNQTLGFNGARSRFTRGAANGSPVIMDSQILDANTNTETHYNARARVDQWGHASFCYVVDDATHHTLKTMRGLRNMVVLSDPAPFPGSSVTCYLDSPDTPNKTYVMGVSFGEGPIQIDWRKLPLSPDPMLLLSIDGSLPSVFQNVVGTLDATGKSSLPALNIPNTPLATGFTLYVAFVVVDPAWTNSVRAISHNASLTIQ